MDYDPVKDRLGAFFWRSPARTRAFYRALDTVFLRAWYVRRQLAWLIGRWEGAGVIGYPGLESANFGQEVVVSHDDRPFLEWHSKMWKLDDEGNKVEPIDTEFGYDLKRDTLVVSRFWIHARSIAQG